MIGLSDAERRQAALFLADIWKCQYRQLRRLPRPAELTINGYVAAQSLVRRATGNEIEGPRLARSPLPHLIGARFG